ncbi:MAG: NADH-quinone oxidoreductase subunit L, partial [Chloroflexia bacterium]|nr:NADH-quinone oxidoreductase subunit L [Chloroflexia bacterium]
MERYLFLIPLLPFAAFAINLLFGRGLIRGQAHWIAVPAVLASWVISVLAFLDVYNNHQAIQQYIFRWIPAGDFTVDVNLYVDQLTAVMLLVVTTVGLLVHIYSIGYMHGDPGYYRFFSYLPLFVFSMLMLVLADNFLLLFVFWEGVGLCSYLLIGYYYKRRSAANAAKKAFIVNRIGDLGFGLAIMWTFAAFGTVSYQEVFARVGEIDPAVITGIALLFFLGACGKSAQFPLHVWLPDAMEGPTPVSALIHAATMVTAGVYLIARAHDLFQASTTAMLVVTLIGLFTAFMAATIGMAQNDMKRVVAYSTLSQLGYMVFALGIGAWVAAIFHLVTHAFFKGLLFLGSGSVIHGMHEEQDIRNMGGLRKFMPLTFWTFLIAAFANAGVIPFAGFWSKDEIIVGGWISDYQPIGTIAMVIGLVSAFFTGLYMFRLIFLVFTGKPRFDTARIHPHESPPSMALPLVLLAIPSLFLGVLIGWPPEDGRLHEFLNPVFYGEAAGDADHAIAAPEAASLAAVPARQEEAGGPHHASTETIIVFAVISTTVALAGIGVAYLTYVTGTISATAMANRYRGLYEFIRDKWRWDELYERLFVQPLRNLSVMLWQVVDVGIIDGAVNGVASGIGAISQRLRHVQTGLVANYALAIALGM